MKTTYDYLAVLKCVDKRLNEVIIVLGEHVIVVRERELAHDIISQVREPPRHVLVLLPK